MEREFVGLNTLVACNWGEGGGGGGVVVRCGIGSQAAQIGDLQGCRAPHQGLPFVSKLLVSTAYLNQVHAQERGTDGGASNMAAVLGTLDSDDASGWRGAMCR